MTLYTAAECQLDITVVAKLVGPLQPQTQHTGPANGRSKWPQYDQLNKVEVATKVPPQ